MVLKFEKYWLFLFISAIIFLLVSISLFSENLALNNRITSLTSSLDSLNDSVSSQNTRLIQLDQTIVQQSELITKQNASLTHYSMQLDLYRSQLRDKDLQLNHTLESLARTSGQLAGTKEQVDNIRQELSNIENTLDSSMNWFKGNAVLPLSLNSFSDDLMVSCVKGDVLNLACVAYLMERDLAFTYRLDDSDKLYSITESVSRNGGDCEDYSLFLSAAINSLKNRRPDLFAESWNTSNSQYTVYEDSRQTWYYPGSARSLSQLSNTYPYMICYTTSFDGSNLSGHCVVTLAHEKFTLGQDVYAINNSPVFEPQNGQYVGTIGKEFILCAETEKNCVETPGRISIVSSDSDMTQFSDGVWKNYYDYKERILQIKSNLG